MYTITVNNLHSTYGEVMSIEVSGYDYSKLIDMIFHQISSNSFILNGGIFMDIPKSNMVVKLDSNIPQYIHLSNVMKNIYNYNIKFDRNSITLDSELIFYKKLLKQIIKAVVKCDNRYLDKLVKKLRDRELNISAYNRDNMTFSKVFYRTKFGLMRMPLHIEFHDSLNSIFFSNYKIFEKLVEKIKLEYKEYDVKCSNQNILAVFISKNVNPNIICDIKTYTSTITNML